MVATPFVAHGAGIEMEVDAFLACVRAVVTDLGGRRADVVAVGIAVAAGVLAVSAGMTASVATSVKRAIFSRISSDTG